MLDRHEQQQQFQDKCKEDIRFLLIQLLEISYSEMNYRPDDDKRIQIAVLCKMIIWSCKHVLTVIGPIGIWAAVTEPKFYVWYDSQSWSVNSCLPLPNFPSFMTAKLRSMSMPDIIDPCSLWRSPEYHFEHLLKWHKNNVCYAVQGVCVCLYVGHYLILLAASIVQLLVTLIHKK